MLIFKIKNKILFYNIFRIHLLIIFVDYIKQINRKFSLAIILYVYMYIIFNNFKLFIIFIFFMYCLVF